MNKSVIAWVLAPLAAVAAMLALQYPLASPASVADIGITALVPPTGGQQLSNTMLLAGFPSNRTLSIVVSTKLEPADTKLSSEYTLSSTEDSNFQVAKTAHANGIERQVVGFVDDHTAVTETRLHLVFDTAMQPQTQYILHGPGLAEAGSVLTYQPQLASASIQVNQIGYAPGADKYATVGNWLGTAGAMAIDDRDFMVIKESTGDIVYQGKLTPRAMADPWSGNDVYEADFSALREPGRYYMKLPTIGESDHFSIAGNVYDDVYRTTARYFYHHRNHASITAPWATPGYERDQGMSPKVDGMFHPGVANSPLGSGEHGYREIKGGWFDAGDYGQYIPNAAPIWYVAGAAIDIAPEHFRDGDFNIPESANGIPDLLDELQWGMDWALSMQDQKDGGVWFRIASQQWDSSLPAGVTGARHIGEKTTHATAAFAAMATIHSRLLKSYRPEAAARALTAAQLAWQFLQNQPQWPPEGELYANPAGTHAGTYADYSAIDNKMWAAAELYRSTGEARYHDVYKQLASQVNIDPTAVVSFRDQGMAALWAYLNADWPDRDRDLHTAALEAVVAGAQWRLRVAAEHPFRAAVHPHMPYLGWGSFAHSTRATLPLMQAWLVTGDEHYRRKAWSTPHAQLGINPQALCYITGLGQRSPRFPLSKLSQYDGVEEPVPGIPVNGPHYYLPASWASTQAVNQGYYPSLPASGNQTAIATQSYPPLRRFTDSQYLPPMSEPTIAEVASIAVAYGLLREDLSTGPEAETQQ